MRTLIIGIIFSAYFLFSCNADKETAGHNHSHDHHDHDHNDHAHDHGHHHDHDHDHNHAELNEGEVALSKVQFQHLGLKISEVSPTEFYQIIKTSGRLLAPLGEENVLVARNDGIVKFSKKDLASGSQVTNREQIALISAKNMAEGDAFAKTKLHYELAEIEFQRAEQLLKDSLISRANYNRIESEYQTASIAYQALAPSASAEGIPVHSSMNGYIKNILVSDGEYVTAGQAIAILSSNRRMQLRAELPERYASLLPHIRSANFKTSDGQATYDLKDLGGRLVSYGKSLDEGGNYFPVSFEFDNTGHLMSGAYVEAFLKSTPKETITLPLQALIEEHGLYFVYTQRRDGVYFKQPVTKGPDDGQRVEILSGIQTGDKVVTKGAYYLKLAGMSAEIPHGHAH